MAPSASPLPRHLASLQYLRALAAIAVVFYHGAIQIALEAGYRIFPLVGESGVDVFFVLSGFVMWVSTNGKMTSWTDFLSRRAIRIVPLYWVLTLSASAVALVAPMLLKSTTFSPSHLAASLLFIPWANPAPHIFAPDRITPVIIPGWTLNLEMMFYLLFSLCLLASSRARPLILAALISALFCVGAAFAPSGSPIGFYKNDMVFEFLGGVLIAAYLAPAVQLRSDAAWWCFAAATACLVASNLVGLVTPRVFQYGLPAAAIIVFAIALERRGAVPKWPMLERLGDASYSIYLSHIFVLAAVRVAFHVAQLSLDPVMAWVFIVVGITASIALGYMLHRIIERPLVDLFNGLIRGRRPPPDRAVIH